jgi:hypothetical protein
MRKIGIKKEDKDLRLYALEGNAGKSMVLSEQEAAVMLIRLKQFFYEKRGEDG